MITSIVLTVAVKKMLQSIRNRWDAENISMTVRVICS